MADPQSIYTSIESLDLKLSENYQKGIFPIVVRVTAVKYSCCFFQL